MDDYASLIGKAGEDIVTDFLEDTFCYHDVRKVSETNERLIYDIVLAKDGNILQYIQVKTIKGTIYKNVPCFYLTKDQYESYCNFSKKHTIPLYFYIVDMSPIFFPKTVTYKPCIRKCLLDTAIIKRTMSGIEFPLETERYFEESDSFKDIVYIPVEVFEEVQELSEPQINNLKKIIQEKKNLEMAMSLFEKLSEVVETSAVKKTSSIIKILEIDRVFPTFELMTPVYNVSPLQFIELDYWVVGASSLVKIITNNKNRSFTLYSNSDAFSKSANAELEEILHIPTVKSPSQKSWFIKWDDVAIFLKKVIELCVDEKQKNNTKHFLSFWAETILPNIERGNLMKIISANVKPSLDDTTSSTNTTTYFSVIDAVLCKALEFKSYGVDDKAVLAALNWASYNLNDAQQELIGLAELLILAQSQSPIDRAKLHFLKEMS